jgi:putative PIN family toxin of toxin-antitoxin system
MITVVMDTNVLVSGLLTPHSPAAMLVRLIVQGSLRLAFDERILAEYREVLTRPRFGFRVEQIENLLVQIEEEGLKIEAQPVNAMLPDPDDLPFLEVALSPGVDYLVTGNAKHYPPRERRGIRVISPRECLESIRR